MNRRHWCAACRYTGRADFLFGMVQAEGYEQALAALLALWSRITPDPPPERFDPVPGMLVFQADDE